MPAASVNRLSTPITRPRDSADEPSFDPAPPVLPFSIASVALAVGFALLVVHAARSGFDHDEIEHLHAAWLVHQGRTPFRDFVEHHPPLIHHLLAPLTRAFEGSPSALVFAARLLNLGLVGFTLAAFVGLAKPLLRSTSLAWAAVLLLSCFFFARNSMEVRPDPWMNAFCLVGLWQWCGYLRTGRSVRAALAGLCFGIAVSFLQKAVVFVGLVGLGSLLAVGLDRREWPRLGRGAAFALAMAAIPLGAFALAVWRAGYWRDFAFWNYTFNRFYSLELNPSDAPGAIATLAVAIGEDPVLWLAGFAGLGIAVASWRKWRSQPELAVAASVVIGILIALFRTRWPFSHNLLLMQPPLALLAAVALDAARGPWRLLIGALLLLSIVKLGVLSLVYTEGGDSRSVQELLLAKTRPTDPIAVPPPYHPIFRPDAFFFWYNSESFSTAYLDCCRRHGCPSGKVDEDRKAWQQRAPVYVYQPQDEPGWAQFDFRKHQERYRQTDVPGLWRLVK